MEAFQAMELGIPLAQMALYVGIITVCMLLRRLKLGLATSYLFVLYWGYFYNRDRFFSLSEELTAFTIVYFVCGFIILVLGIVSFFLHEGR
ncbi:MAG: hypothetical protein ABID54_03435 [Pseudomonadota bacterium]